MVQNLTFSICEPVSAAHIRKNTFSQVDYELNKFPMFDYHKLA